MLRRVDDSVELHDQLFRAVPLTADDGPRVQHLLEACADYFELTFGHPPGRDEAQSLFYAGPEIDTRPDNKMLLGIWETDGDKLLGVIDAFRDYPDRGSWYIGLLLLSPHVRGSGLGKRVLEAFAARARAGGAREIQLNVVEQNAAGRRFWESAGFAELRRWRRRLGKKGSTLIRMRRELGEHKLARLSVAVRHILARKEYPSLVKRLKQQALASSEPYVWSVVEMTRNVPSLVPGAIKSAWIFVLKRDTPSGNHFHPNSIQHMVMIEGQGRSHIGGVWSDLVRFADTNDPERAWVIIPEGTPHEFFPETDEMVVISFHTCPSDELVEIDAITGKPRLYEPAS